MIANEETYGPRWASVYDTVVPEGPAAGQAADVLTALARQAFARRCEGAPAGDCDVPRALELGVGTGRVAVPLAERGIRVHGIDLEPAMLEVLHGKIRARGLDGRLSTAVGDMTVREDLLAPDGSGAYDLVYCVLNTLGSLADGSAQRAALAAAAGVLAEGGRLVVEAPVPVLDSFTRSGTRVSHLGRRGDGVWMETARLDPVDQVVSLESIVLSEEEGVRIQPVHYRYTWPSELDLMAELGGLRRVARHGGWAGEEFTARPGMYVVQYARAGADLRR
ncbi:class I SAM-dependent methyltransferase [Streptomyces sp. MST-110588]|uniref:methyltransferase domain-containing protein n=1 Tax=Streptomyces sp. MST-110588 TaxID=2833628 RepID=UPI001F5C343A|nr:class I SAM-dependent methyltransferase [Streptomyces sp. MST-110588]UNO41652.1 class I SAM-dependent methyltransferase [Streptomyces sp. MST-110588]